MKIKHHLHILLMRILLGASFFIATNIFAESISEIVYVESPTDTDSDRRPDLIYVSIERPNLSRKLATIYTISPYALGGNQVEFHNVDTALLPQDELILDTLRNGFKSATPVHKIPLRFHEQSPLISSNRYARVSAHSLGTGKSTGCPTVGDMAETMAAKSVIDWLNGRARAFYQDGTEAKADWANGLVAMTGVSYDGTLPIMVATTGVEGLKAIVPIAAISNWYDYYRANGLVVNPGGYIGEDADVLGYYIVRKGSCKNEMMRVTELMGREHGDYTPFWQERNYVARAKGIKAATFIIHGQSDWNVKQKHAIQLWESLEGIAARKMFLHRGGHGSTYNYDVPKKIQAWFDHYLEGDDNGINEAPLVEIEMPDGSLMAQNAWPSERTNSQRFFFNKDFSLSKTTYQSAQFKLVDAGSSQKIESLVKNPSLTNESRLVFLTDPFARDVLLSGSASIDFNVAVMNRKAANITVALIEYDKNDNGKVITRGWMDPQNNRDLQQGKILTPGHSYQLSFMLEPKQYKINTGSRLGVLIASTDYDYTLRPKNGTVIQFDFDERSYIDLRLSAE
jgi:X-Pro dipeptidyl-peptidase